MKVTILPAGVEEAKTLAEIHAPSWKRAYRGVIPDEILDSFTVESGVEPFCTAIARGEERYFLARVEGRGAGLLSLHHSHETGEPETVGEIYAFYVHPDFWRTGLAGQMMAFAMSELARSGFSRVNIWVLAENARARAFYEKWGFSLDGKEAFLSLGRELQEVRYTKEI